MLDLLKINCGVIMISFLPNLTDSSPESGATVGRVADHIVHVAQSIGYKHVGIGSDFDGMIRGPNGLEDVSKFPALIAELLERQIPEESVRDIIGLNVLRVMEEVEKVSWQMKVAKEDFLCDQIEPFWDEAIRSEVVQVRLGRGS